MFRIVEEYTKTITKNPDKNIFSSWRKLIFKISKFQKKTKNQNFDKQSEKSKFEKTSDFQQY